MCTLQDLPSGEVYLAQDFYGMLSKYDNLHIVIVYKCNVIVLQHCIIPRIFSLYDYEQAIKIKSDIILDLIHIYLGITNNPILLLYRD